MMKQKLIIDGNAVYELDEKCMLKKRVDDEERKKQEQKKDKNKKETGAF